MDPFYKDFDYKAAVLFWCSDLIIRGPELGAFRVTTPKGRNIAEARTERGAWVMTLAVIFVHLDKVRRARKELES